jgi:hypothetical protein
VRGQPRTAKFTALKPSNYTSAGTSMGRKQCSGYVALTTHFNSEDGGSTASETVAQQTGKPIPLNSPPSDLQITHQKLFDWAVVFSVK